MKPFFIILWLISIRSVTIGQTERAPNLLTEPDSLNSLIRETSQDTNRALLLIQLASDYRFYKTDSAIIIAKEAIQLSRRLNFTKGEVRALNVAGEAYRFQGEFPQALEYQFNALKISKDRNDREGEANSLNSIGFIYVEMSEYREGLNYLFQAKKLNERFSFELVRSLGLSYIGFAYEKMNVLDSALIFQRQAYEVNEQLPQNLILGSVILVRLGLIQFRLGNNDQALRYYRSSLESTNFSGDIFNRARVQYRLADLYYKMSQLDSSLVYARLSFVNGGKISQKGTMLDASSLLIKLYKARHNIDSAFYYQEVAMGTKDSIYGVEKFKRLQLLTFKEQQRQKEIQQEQEQYKNKIRTYALIAGLAVFLFIALFFYRNNRQKQKANILLQKQKQEIESTLTELRLTQNQLIQSEKMASLGELTAGIAHEIQNPLNFVNNFSEVNKELITEMKNELLSNNKDEAISISNDIEENLEKIAHHGKRADAIVKGMLQHTRTSTGKKDFTDVNALTDEYLRLSYHGFRAKDKSFNATIVTHFGEKLGKIEVVPQDIGRVLLNLFNNAFYAINERKKQQPQGYEPTVTVTTKKAGDKIEIRVKDNGLGIPQKVVDKIFQPFFTTKPTGMGTGLGLSLSYDIIKAHGGEIKVETKAGEGSEFIIQLS